MLFFIRRCAKRDIPQRENGGAPRTRRIRSSNEKTVGRGVEKSDYPRQSGSSLERDDRNEGTIHRKRELLTPLPNADRKKGSEGGVEIDSPQPGGRRSRVTTETGLKSGNGVRHTGKTAGGAPVQGRGKAWKNLF